MDFGFLKKIFSFGKKNDDMSPDEIKSLEAKYRLPSSSPSQPSIATATTPAISNSNSPSPSSGNIAADNIKAKLDLMTMQMDGMKIQYESLNQRLIQIENMVRSIYESTRPSPTSRY